MFFRSKTSRLFIILLACSLYLLLCTSPVLSSENPVTLRVGYDPAGNYLYQDQKGDFQGYNAEYLYEIAKYTGWEYEFIPYKQWAKAVQALQDGEIDLLPTVLKAPGRETTMLFSQRPMSSIYMALVVPPSDEQHCFGDLDSLQGAHIGIRQNTADAGLFIQWAREQDLSYVLQPFAAQSDLIDALDHGQIDAAATSYAGKARSYRAIAEFSPQGMYFAMPRSETLRMRQLDSAMEQIAVMDPGFFERIARRHIENDVQPKPVFSQTEQEFIAQAPPIRITLLRQRFPYSYLNGTTSQGILPDFLDRLAELSGLSFEIVPVDSPEQALQAIAENRADIIGDMTEDLIFAKRHHLRTTSPYVYLSMVQIARKQTTDIQHIALQSTIQKNALEQKPASENSSLPLHFEVYPESSACFAALTDGKADAIYVDSATASYFLNTHRASEYKLVPLPNDHYNLVLGISDQADHRLASILDKCIRFAGPDALSDIIAKNNLPQTTSLTMILEQIPGQYLLVFCTLLLCAALLLAYTSFSLWRRRGIERRITAINERNRQIAVELETARRVNEVKGEFFAHISHDMRTPLNGITGFTRLAAEADTLEDARSYIEKIRISNVLLLDLVEDTLQLSKLERGNFQLHWEPTDSHRFISEVITPIQLLAEEKGIHFSVDSNGFEPRRIMTDRLNTRKILLNLLSNSIKFTPPGGTIQLLAESALSATNRFVCWIRIKDTGCGISKEFLPHIYEPFSQERTPGVTALPGNGLGLSIVRRLIDLMGGEITITSQPGKGTEVSLELFFELADTREAAHAAIYAAANFTALQGKRVLLCEDNELNTEITKALLEQKGMEVICATNGQEGVEHFALSQPYHIDFILMDLRMPVLDGYKASQQIRRMSRPDAQTVPIIALSADAFAEDIAHCHAAGMNAHIAKPLDPEKLFQEFLRQWKNRRDTSTPAKET